jgi:hypothetical protein
MAYVTAGPEPGRVIRVGGPAYWLSAGLAVTAAAGSLLTFTIPSVLPGAALLIGVAVPQLGAAALIGSGGRHGLAAGYLAGLLLVAWIAVELLILRRYFFLQPVIAAIGAAETLLAWRWQRAAGARKCGLLER